MPTRDERLYVGEYDERGIARIWHVEGDYRREVPRVIEASPGGLAWGYLGNGPSDTARTILADAFGDRRAADAYWWEFAEEFVERLPRNTRFELPAETVESWLVERGFMPPAIAAMAPERPLPTNDVDVVAWAHDLEREEQRLQRWATQLAVRERSVAKAEVRLGHERGALLDHGDVVPAWSLPAEPVARELRAVMSDAECTVESAAREFGLDEAWARDVVAGLVETVDLPHVQQVCEAWSCTPYDFWGTEVARTIVHAYPPELWPRHIAPLWQWDHHRLEGGGIEPPGPELGP
jgi:hypothetical protein